MRILVVDDDYWNLKAAKEAATKFSEHEFIFTDSAKEALAKLAEVDALVTDLFFPPEGHDDGGELGVRYALFCSRMINNPAFPEVVQSYYGGDSREAEGRLRHVLALLEDGTIRVVIEDFIRIFEERGQRERVDDYSKRLKNLPSPQFAYGGALMLLAKELGKRHCLVSDINRHAGGYRDAQGAVDGMVLLLPLMGEGIISVNQVRNNGNGSLTYLGYGEVHQIGKEVGKNNPAVWADAIRRILAQ